MADLEGIIAGLTSKRTAAERYLKALTGRNGPLMEFETLAWQAVVDPASISADGTVTFFLRDGSEEKEYVQSGVRSYRRRGAVNAEVCAV